MPVHEQCFTTKRTTWISAENNHDWLAELNNLIFNNQDTIEISRYDIFNTPDVRVKILKTIYWGYPSGMRGDNFANIISELNQIEYIITEASVNNNLTIQDWTNISMQMNDIQGIELSTYSKLLYFFNLAFDNLNALILDKRIVNVFNNNKFDDFEFPFITYANAQIHYISYLQQMNEASINLNASADKIEAFLFTFGNNLKAIHP
jgi:hypothetical protein